MITDPPSLIKGRKPLDSPLSFQLKGVKGCYSDQGEGRTPLIHSTIEAETYSRLEG